MANEMPLVTRCDVLQCFYNKSNACHAPAINVGGDHPSCDTFLAAGDHIARSESSTVGACHVAQCKFNDELTCHAASIMVGVHNDHADCNTFTLK